MVSSRSGASQLTGFEREMLRLQAENNVLLRENNRILKEYHAILKQDHHLIASLEDNVRKIKINTS